MPRSAAEQTDCTVEPHAHAALLKSRFNDYYAALWHEGWTRISGGIVLAASAYPILLGSATYLLVLVMCVINLLDGNFLNGQPPTAYDVILGLLSSLVMIPFMLGIAGAIGAILGGAVAAVVATALHIVLRSLELRPRPVLLGAFTGGLVGFLCCAPLVLLVDDPITIHVNALMILMACGPCLTTVLGQLGGAWGGNRVKWYDREIAIAQVTSCGSLAASVHGVGHDSTTGVSQRLQFSICQLLWICLWVCMLLMLIRVSGIPFPVALPLLLGWLLFQTLTMWLGGRLVRRLAPWWARRRQGRST